MTEKFSLTNVCRRYHKNQPNLRWRKAKMISMGQDWFLHTTSVQTSEAENRMYEICVVIYAIAESVKKLVSSFQWERMGRCRLIDETFCLLLCLLSSKVRVKANLIKPSFFSLLPYLIEKVKTSHHFLYYKIYIKSFFSS